MSSFGERAVPLRLLGERWAQLESRLWEQRFNLFGDTPMKQALDTVSASLERSSRHTRRSEIGTDYHFRRR